MSVTVSTQQAFAAGLRLGRMIDRGNPGGCWIWLGHLDKRGYGRTYFRGRAEEAHRVVYELAVGPIPDGLHVDHLCRVRACVNPSHLEAVSQAENNRRQKAAQTRCRHGHEWTAENTLRDARGSRRCRTCNRASCQRYRLAAEVAS